MFLRGSELIKVLGITYHIFAPVRTPFDCSMHHCQKTPCLQRMTAAGRVHATISGSSSTRGSIVSHSCGSERVRKKFTVVFEDYFGSEAGTEVGSVRGNTDSLCPGASL